MKTSHYIYACLLAIFVSNSVYGQDAGKNRNVATDTLEVHFRVGQSNLDFGYADNERRISDFTRLVQQRYAKASKESMQLNIYAGASPEGPAELNRRLGEQRGIALKEILENRLGGLVEHVTVVNQGARWGALSRMIEQSNEPWKYDVLKILAEEPADEWTKDPRETKLRQLRRGEVWKVLNTKYLPQLRSSGSAVIMELTEEQLRDTLVIRDTIVYLPDRCPQYADPIDHTPVIALKTNFLLWGVIAPNAQVEVPLGTKNRWSIAGEVFWPWWIWNHNTNAHQCGDVGLELRYWLGDRMKHHLIDGWHIGLGAAAGYYDFEWKKHEGYQGEYLNIYGNIGYQHRWGKRKQWAIDAGVGFGWIPTNYREYLGSSIFPVGHEEEPDGTKEDPHLMWQKTSWKHIVGLTHANITLAYIIRTSKKTKIYTSIDDERIPVYEPAPEPLTGAEAGKEAQRLEKQGRTKTKAQAKADKEAAKAPASSVSYAATSSQPTKADKKAAKAAAKQAEKEAKAAAKQAEKEAKAAAKAEIEAEKAAKKAAKQAAKEAKKAK